MKDPKINEIFTETYDLANKLSITGTPSYVVGNEVVFGAQGRDLLTEKVAVAKAACAASAACCRGAASDHSSFGRESRGIPLSRPFRSRLSQTIEGSARRRGMARAEGFQY